MSTVGQGEGGPVLPSLRDEVRERVEPLQELGEGSPVS